MLNDPEIYVLVNPSSGQGSGRALLQEFQQCSQAEGLVVEAVDFARHAEQIGLARRSKICIIVGGDGTISTIAGHLGNCPTKIGVLPLGTGNDFARELDLLKRLASKTVPQILEFFRTARSKAVSVFAVEFGSNFERRIPFINYASLGFEAQVVKDFEQWRKARARSQLQSVWLNRLAYAVLSSRHLFYKNGQLNLTAAGRAVKVGPSCSLIFANVKSIMGLGISNLQGSLFDDKIECVLAPNSLSYLSMLTNLKLPFFRPKLLGSETYWEISELPGDLLIQIDGESVTLNNPKKIRIQILHKINVLY